MTRDEAIKMIRSTCRSTDVEPIIAALTAKNDPADFEESYRAETRRVRAALDEALRWVSEYADRGRAEDLKARILAMADGKA